MWSISVRTLFVWVTIDPEGGGRCLAERSTRLKVLMHISEKWRSPSHRVPTLALVLPVPRSTSRSTVDLRRTTSTAIAGS